MSNPFGPRDYVTTVDESAESLNWPTLSEPDIRRNTISDSYTYAGQLDYTTYQAQVIISNDLQASSAERWEMVIRRLLEGLRSSITVTEDQDFRGQSTIYTASIEIPEKRSQKDYDNLLLEVEKLRKYKEDRLSWLGKVK